ncbi:DNA (cytosine-5-)-methyltransferase [Lactiplantibacillus argentoratensis]|uniref:DNA (cytosine-5-)-methyltransferase n=1 Tax=Lactiplantibacillus argentoratensis TaxID=271881 RepID=UPI003F52AFD5
MRFIDMFAGIGGFHLGMEQAGHQCVGWIEWDKFARQSYQAIHNVKGMWNASDIRTVRASELPRADCWCFGFPCQDISVAGKQKGFTAGKRSSLFFTVTGLIRDLKEEDRPSYLLIENVKNLLSINRGFDFLKLQIELDEIGYDVEWSVLDSAEVVPQHRERIFIVGHLRGRRTRKVFPIVRKNGETTEQNVIKVVGNTSDTGHGSKDVLDPTGISTTLMSRDYKGPKQIAINQVGNISNSKYFGGNPQVGRVYDTEGIAPTLSTMQGGGQEPKIAIPVSSPDIVNKTQNGRRFKENGDPEFALTVRDRHGVLINVNEPKFAVREATKIGYDIAKLGDSINFAQPNSKTRRGRVGHGVANTLTTSVEQATLTDDFKIRKLTPLETWRLQGFPDWAFNRAKQAGLSDSQLYKQAGNSVTVPVIKAIAEKMELP